MALDGASCKVVWQSEWKPRDHETFITQRDRNSLSGVGVIDDWPAHTLDRLLRATDLRRAVERREFRVHYQQPIVSLETGRISGFEALLRWQHPARGLILPAAFISVAEETGLIISIGQWILREACRQTRIWQEQIEADPPLMISVNLGSKEFSQPDLSERISEMLLETGFDARSLKLEITEMRAAHVVRNELCQDIASDS